MGDGRGGNKSVIQLVCGLWLHMAPATGMREVEIFAHNDLPVAYPEATRGGGVAFCLWFILRYAVHP